MIIQTLAHSPRHFTAEEIKEELSRHTRTINLATVYRTLDFLWKEGFACRNDLSEGKIVYSTTEHGPHIHLVCRKCEKVTDARVEILDILGAGFQSDYGFKPDLDHFSVFGICNECKE
jgi:Fur family ferric uptake transcriptional regulator